VREIDLLDSYPKVKRDIDSRAAAVEEQREVAKRFGREYFDGDRTQGYGGYRYDGRWVRVAERFRDEYGISAGMKILDVGSGKGFLLHDFRQVIPGVEVFGLDISEYGILNSMEDVRSRIVQGTAASLPFPDAAFDIVTCINTIHNLPLDLCKQAVREIERVKRPGGRSYIQVDSWLTEEQHQKFERWQLTAQTYFEPERWRQLFAEAGYSGDFYWTLTE
jgi:SAM-dependent methyltransferase